MIEAEPSREGGARPTTIDDVLRGSGGRREIRRLPVLVLRAFQLVWASAPRQLLMAGSLQVLAGLSLAAQLLVMRWVLDTITNDVGAPDVGALAFDLTLFGILLVVVAVARVAQGARSSALWVSTFRSTPLGASWTSRPQWI